MLEILPSVVAEAVLRNMQVPKLGRDRVERARTRRPDVHGRRAAGELRADQHRRRWHGSQRHGRSATRARMWVCAVSCREMLPDPAFFADCLRESIRRNEGGRRCSEARLAVAERRAARRAPAAAREGTQAKPREAAARRGGARSTAAAARHQS